LIDVFYKIVNTIFPLRENESARKGSITDEKIFAASLINKIKDNEDKVSITSYEATQPHNEIISNLSELASVQKILDIKLESVVVRILSTISKKSGAAIPTTIIPTTGTNDVTLLRERAKLEKANENRFFKSYLVNNGGLLGTTIKLETIFAKGEKDAAEFNILENFTSHFQYDFLDSLKDKGLRERTAINIMIGNYADKSRILDKSIDRSVKINERFIIRNDIETSADKPSENVLTSDEILEESRKQSFNYYKDVVLDIIEKYQDILNIDLSKLYSNGNLNVKAVKKTLNDINAYLRQFKKDSFLDVIYNSNKNFIKEVHYSFYKDNVSLNNNILDYFSIYEDPSLYKAFIEKQRESFIYKLQDVKGGNVLISPSNYASIQSSQKGENDVFKKIVYSLGIDYNSFKEEFMEDDNTVRITSKTSFRLNPLASK